MAKIVLPETGGKNKKLKVVLDNSRYKTVFCPTSLCSAKGWKQKLIAYSSTLMVSSVGKPYNIPRHDFSSSSSGDVGDEVKCFMFQTEHNKKRCANFGLFKKLF